MKKLALLVGSCKLILFVALQIFSGIALKAQTLGEALDATNLTWTTSGSGTWFVETNVTHDGISAVQSPAVAAGGSSTLQTAVQGPGTLTFWWRELLGTCTFKAGASPLASITAISPNGGYMPTDWQQPTFYLGSNDQLLEWVQSYPGNAAFNINGCWLDQVSYSPGSTAAIIISVPASACAVPGFEAMFYVVTTGTPPMAYQWQFRGTNIADATASSLIISNVQASDYGTDYSVVVTNSGGTRMSPSASLVPGNVAVWGRQDSNQIFVPANASNSVAIASGGYHSLALRPDGRIVAWGDNSYGQTTVPAGLANVVAISGATYHSLALKRDSTATAWGSNVRYFPGFGGSEVTLTQDPTAYTNLVGVAGGDAYGLALEAEGTVAPWGLYLPSDLSYWAVMFTPSGLSNVVAIAGGRNHALALKADGTVVAWGRDAEGQTNVPPDLTNVVAVAAGANHCVALKGDGLVVAWGDNGSGQASVPPNLSNVVAIAGGDAHSLALRGDGTVVAWGTNFFGQVAIPTPLTNGGVVAAGGGHSLALLNPSYPAPFLTTPLINRFAPAKGNVQFYALATGAWPLSYQWQHNGTNLPGATAAILSLGNVQLSDAGPYQVMVTNSYGRTTSSSAILTVYGLGDALGAAGGAWSTTGDAQWFVETSVTHESVAAVQSGAITNNQTSTLQTSFNGPGTLGFWWKVSSKTNQDFLSVSVSGVPQEAISGEVDWSHRTIYLGSGLQTVQWMYEKGVSGRAGQDAAWLDQVAWIPGPVAPIITIQPANVSAGRGMNAGLSVSAGGTPPLNYQWWFNGQSLSGATSSSLVITNVQASNVGVYSVLVSNQVGTVLSSNALLTLGQVIAWGANSYGQTNVPPGLTDVLGIAGGWHHSVVLKGDGTVIAWGANNAGQTNVPVGLSNVVAIASRSGDHSMALRANGTVVVWGDNSQGQTNVPVGLSNVVAISAGGYRCLALRADGTAVAWGDSRTVPAGLSNLVAVSAGDYASLFLRSDGTVAATGTAVPASVTNITAIAAGGLHNLALRANGTVTAWGDNSEGQTSVPPGLDKVVAIAAGDYHNTALRADGTVVAWGRYNTVSGYIVPVVPVGLTNVLAIAAGSDHDLALLGEAPFILVQPVSLRVTIGSNATFGVTVTALPPPTFQWRKDGVDISGATASILGLTGIGPGAGGFYSVAVSNKFGVLSSSNALLTINYPPVADASASVLEVLSPNGTNETVVLDGSRSSDQDGDLLQFLWSDASNGKPLATGIVAVITLPLGTNGITLSVSDGLVSVEQTILVRVLSTYQAVAELITVVNQAVSKPGPLVSTLSAALASIYRGNLTAAVGQLGAFRNMVNAQVAPLDPSLAGGLVRSAQSIAQILGGAAAPHARITIHRQASGKISLQLSSRPVRTSIIEVSTNLVDWEAIGSAPGDDGGSFEFEDPNSGGLPSRYYRLVQP